MRGAAVREVKTSLWTAVNDLQSSRSWLNLFSSSDQQELRPAGHSRVAMFGFPKPQFLSGIVGRMFSKVFLSLTLAVVVVGAEASFNGTANDVIGFNVTDDVDVGESLEAADGRSFDFFVFSQIWPITSCDIWEDRSDGNSCFLPELSEYGC